MTSGYTAVLSLRASPLVMRHIIVFGTQARNRLCELPFFLSEGLKVKFVDVVCGGR